jgi:hypothetical protein
MAEIAYDYYVNKTNCKTVNLRVAMPYKEMSQIRHVGFLTLNNFSMIAFTNALEILRMANYLLGEEAYQWSVCTVDGQAVTASNGLAFAKTTMLDPAHMPDVLLVCGGVDIQHAVNHDVIKLLTHTSKYNMWLGGLCTGSYALAKAVCWMATNARFIGRIWRACASSFRRLILWKNYLSSTAIAVPAPAARRRSI